MTDAEGSPSATPACLALQALCDRYSVGPKHLDEPGPDSAALDRMVQAALRAPDHAELVPFRFVVVRGQARARLAALFREAALAAGKDAAGAALDAERAERPPVTVVVVARIDAGHPLVPAHEQWVALGAALGQLMQAAHLMGYAGKMLSGAKVRHPALQRAFCAPGETLLGWVVLGTARAEDVAMPGKLASKRSQRKPAPGQVWSDWQGAGPTD